MLNITNIKNERTYGNATKLKMFTNKNRSNEVNVNVENQISWKEDKNQSQLQLTFPTYNSFFKT